MVTAKQNLTKETTSKSITSDNHHWIEGRTQGQENYKTGRKQSRKALVILITLNINGLNYPIKRHRGIEWIKTKTQPQAV